MLMGARMGHPIPWEWSCRWLRAVLWLLEIEPGLSGRAASAPHCSVISLDPGDGILLLPPTPISFIVCSPAACPIHQSSSLRSAEDLPIPH